MPGSIQHISAEKLSLLTGLTDRRHRQLAADGWFPRPERGQYELVKTLQGMFRFYREAQLNTRDRINELKAGKLQRETEKIELEMQRMSGATVKFSEVNDFMFQVAVKQKLLLYQRLHKQMPARANGLNASELSVLGRTMADAICEIMARDLEEWNRERKS